MRCPARPAGRWRLLVTSLGSLALLTITACGPSAQTSAAGRPSPPLAVAGGTLGLGIVGLIVRDLPASLAFYRRRGLAIPAEVDTSSGAFRLPQPNGQILFWRPCSTSVTSTPPTCQAPATAG